MPDPAPPIVLTIAPVWKGCRNGLRALMEVATSAKSIAASVKILGRMVVSVGLGFSDGAR